MASARRTTRARIGARARSTASPTAKVLPRLCGKSSPTRGERMRQPGASSPGSPWADHRFSTSEGRNLLGSHETFDIAGYGQGYGSDEEIHPAFGCFGGA